jgi:hypothetical protein
MPDIRTSRQSWSSFRSWACCLGRSARFWVDFALSRCGRWLMTASDLRGLLYRESDNNKPI